MTEETTKTDNILPNETILPDVLRPPAFYLKKARKWADCPHRFFVDEFIHQAKMAGEVGATEVWAIYEILQKAEKRGYKETKPNVTEPLPKPDHARRRRSRNSGDAA